MNIKSIVVRRNGCGLSAEKYSAIPERKVVVGNPAKIIKDVSDQMIKWKSEGTKIYQKLPKECIDSLKETLPHSSFFEYKNEHTEKYKTWKKSK